jgi:hypothetical protein
VVDERKICKYTLWCERESAVLYYSQLKLAAFAWDKLVSVEFILVYIY